MENALVRAALVQLQYHPALFADFRCPLEDPGGLEGLLVGPIGRGQVIDLSEYLVGLRMRGTGQT